MSKTAISSSNRALSVETINTDTLVVISNDQPTTTSLKIAEYFGKRHDDVLKKIKTLETSQEFRDRNFAECDYSVETNGISRKYPMYQITKDGFTFLTMGFTGAKAAKFKENYILAFNKMEQTLKNQTQTTPNLNAQLGEALMKGDFTTVIAIKSKLDSERFDKLESQIRELKEEPKVFNLEVKNLTQIKGFDKMRKDELGRSINKCVEIIGNIHHFTYNQELFKTEGEFYAKRHHFVRELYIKETGRVYLGAEIATNQDKEDYKNWLLRYSARVQ